MTNPNSTTSSPRKTMLRALLLAPVAIGVLAGTVVTGTGIGAAASADSAGSAGPGWASQLSDPVEVHKWTVTNHTEGSVWGDLTMKNRENTSNISIGSNPALAPGDSSDVAALTAEPFYMDYTWGRLCFNKSSWDLPRARYPVTQKWDRITTFELVQSGADGKQLAVNVEGQQFPLTPVGGTC